ncbi:MAG: four helix bundle protein [bacterium]
MNLNKYSLDEFELYKHAREYRKNIYKVIKKLPDEEKYCLAPQMRKAAISISNNIAEGHGRWHFQENIQFCTISRGSTEEIINDLNLCLDEKYGDPAENYTLKEEGYLLIKKINGYIAYLKKMK